MHSKNLKPAGNGGFIFFAKDEKTTLSQQQTAFATWFGDSKIVNPDGSPRVMYLLLFIVIPLLMFYVKLVKKRFLLDR